MPWGCGPGGHSVVVMVNAIEIDGLVKRFGSFTALSGLDLQVRAGEVHGLLGPNGAGKSTAIRVVLGLLRADGGSVSLLGGDPWRDAVALHRRLAYVPGDVSLWPGMTGGEAIDLLGTLRGGLDEGAVLLVLLQVDADRAGAGRGGHHLPPGTVRPSAPKSASGARPCWP